MKLLVPLLALLVSCNDPAVTLVVDPAEQVIEVGQNTVVTLTITAEGLEEFNLEVAETDDSDSGTVRLDEVSGRDEDFIGSVEGTGLGGNFPLDGSRAVVLEYTCLQEGEALFRAGAREEAASREVIADFGITCTASEVVGLPYEFIVADGDGKLVGCITEDDPSCAVLDASSIRDFPAATVCASHENVMVALGGGAGSAWGARYDGSWHDISPSEHSGNTLTELATDGVVWAACSNDAALFSEDDGESWQSATGLSSCDAVFHGDGLFLASEGTLFTSEDGSEWTDTGSGFGDGTPLGAVWTGTEWLGMETIPFGSGVAIFRSTDGVDWTASSGGAPGLTQFGGLAYGNGVFVAVGDSEIWISSDGDTWMNVTPAGALRLFSVVYSEPHESFVVGGAEGALWHSDDDGATWTELNHPNASEFLSIQSVCSAP